MAPTSDSGERCPLIQDDHKRQQPNSITEQRSRRTKYLVVLCILFVELCERLTFYGLSANLVFYCKNVLKLASPISSTIALVFQGKVMSTAKDVTSIPISCCLLTISLLSKLLKSIKFNGRGDLIFKMWCITRERAFR